MLTLKTALILFGCLLATLAAAACVVWCGTSIVAAAWWVLCALWIGSDALAGRSYANLPLREIHLRLKNAPPLPTLALSLRAAGVFVAVLATVVSLYR